MEAKKHTFFFFSLNVTWKFLNMLKGLKLNKIFNKVLLMLLDRCFFILYYFTLYYIIHNMGGVLDSSYPVGAHYFSITFNITIIT